MKTRTSRSHLCLATDKTRHSFAQPSPITVKNLQPAIFKLTSPVDINVPARSALVLRNKSFAQIEHRAGAGGWPRGFGFKSQSPLLNIHFRLSGFQSSLKFPTYSLPQRPECTVHTAVKCGTKPIRYVTCDVPLLRSAQRSFVPLQKSLPDHRSSCMCEQKPYRYPVLFSGQRKSSPVQCVHSPKLPYLRRLKTGRFDTSLFIRGVNSPTY